MKKSLFTFVIMAAMFSCSDKNPEEALAKDYMLQATNAIDDGQYTIALAWLDSIDQRCPTQIDARKQGNSLRAQAIEQVTIQQIQSTDSIIAASQLSIERFEPLMKHISGGDLEGYYVVANAYNPNFINTTGVEPRVNDADFNFYIVAQNKGKQIGIDKIVLKAGTESIASEAIPSTSARVQVVEGGELATFLPEEVANLGPWAQDHLVTSAVIEGRKGNVPVKLTDKQAAAFVTAWAFSKAKLKHRQALIVREKLERQLQIARDHRALSSDSIPGIE